MDIVWEFSKGLLYPMRFPYARISQGKTISYKKYYDTVYQLQKRKVLKIVKKNGENFIELVKKGELEALLNKSDTEKGQKWDGKWRVVVFDIPEEAHTARDHFRRMLKNRGFVLLQASVFINPFPLNRTAIKYLHESGLDKYIRILKVEEIDNDFDLKKKFGLL